MPASLRRQEHVSLFRRHTRLETGMLERREMNGGRGGKEGDGFSSLFRETEKSRWGGMEEGQPLTATIWLVGVGVEGVSVLQSLYIR